MQHINHITKLKQGITALNVKYTEQQITQLLEYLLLIQKWNKSINLTAVDELEEMVSIHLLDSLSILPFVKNATAILDLGTGAGLPGIPLSIFLPNQKIVLLEKAHKKCTFLRNAINTLSLPNVEVVHSRVEDYNFDEKFDLLLTRAVGQISDIVKMSRHLVKPTGHFLFMKGKNPKDEIANLEASIKLIILDPINVPFLDAERHVVKVYLKNTMI